MACPTCDTTMQRIGAGSDIKYYWCPRCGTLRVVSMTVQEDGIPTLISRVRLVRVKDQDEWNRLGIEEAINLPNNRPQQVGK